MTAGSLQLFICAFITYALQLPLQKLFGAWVDGEQQYRTRSVGTDQSLGTAAAQAPRALFYKISVLLLRSRRSTSSSCSATAAVQHCSSIDDDLGLVLYRLSPTAVMIA